LKITTRLFLAILPQKLKKLIAIETFPFRNNSYSQEGEDLIIDKLLGYKKNGFFVDIGAHHPLRFSNTAIFYKRGWKGINIDAMPDSMVEFNKLRKLDINLETAISNEEETKLFYIFNEPALNTLNKEEALSKDGKNGYKILQTIEVKTVKLKTVFNQYIGNNEIDFISIDTEGNDLNVLKSNDWKKYKPKLILVEELKNKQFHDLINSELVTFLKEHNYSIVAKTINTLFFKLNATE
jgi:FkbM family methyltransferase